MARKSSIAVDKAARAGSRLPTRWYRDAQAKMTVGLERAHAQLLGQGEGLAVVGGGFVDVRGSAMRGDLAEEAQGIRLVAALLVLAGEIDRLRGELARLLQAASQQMRLPEGETTSAAGPPLSRATVCSIACVSSDTASATRPARVYAAPKTAAVPGNMAGKSAS